MSNGIASGGRFTASQFDWTITPRIPAGRRAVLYGHGAGGDATECGGAFSLSNVPPIVQAVGDRFVFGSPTATALWGNSTSRTRRSSLWTGLKSTYGASTAAPLGLGISHGVTDLLLWHKNTQALAALVAILPPVDLEAIRTADTLSLRAGIDAAHGVTYPAALPAGVNPAENTGSYTNLPMQIWYSNTDAVSANIVTFGTAVGAEMHDMGALSHGNTAVGTASIPQIIAFLEAHA